MGLSKNTLDRSDISTYPVKVKYSASYASSSAINYGITVNRGINSSFESDPTEFLVYKLAQQLYYNSYVTGAANNSASYWEDNLQSTAASGTFDNDYRYFPTGSGDEITVLCIPASQFGENISRKSFRLSSANYNLIDDGNGNVIDSDNGNVHVGNILYRQGIIIVTNLDYEYALIAQIPTTTTTTSTTTTTTSTTSTTTTSTTTTTTTLAPASILWGNSELASPFIDSDLYINENGGTIVSETSNNSATVSVAANSSIYSQQNSMGGTIGNYRLLIQNITDSLTLYDSTVSAGSLPATVNTFTFTAATGKSYYVSASVSEIPTTTTTTSTTSTSTTSTSTTTSTTTAAPTTTTTSTTTSTTTEAPTTTSTTTSTTTEAPTTTSTTTSTTTETPTTTTTSTTTSTTTEAPTTTTTTSTTTEAPTTTTTSTTTSTTTETPTTSTTTTTTTAAICCYQYEITNYYTTSKTIFYTDCDLGPTSVSAPGNGVQTIINCAVSESISYSATTCDGGSTDCIAVVQANTPCGGCITTTTTTTSTTTTTTTAAPTTTTTTTTEAPTTTTTSTTTTTTTEEITCSVYTIENLSGASVGWAGNACISGDSVNGSVANGQTGDTPCVRDNTFSYGSAPGVTITNIVPC